MIENLIVGAGAAGVFASLVAGKAVILEKTAQPLSKVKISGGGRCNVTHSCFEPVALCRSYPRGNKALLGPFTRFQPQDMIDWLAQRGVSLKTEEDGRMFPTTDSSQTIIECFLQEADRLGIEIRYREAVESIERKEGLFHVKTNVAEYKARNLLLATGSHPQGHQFAAQLGHTIIPPVPSLFTFNVPSSPLLDLAGISVEEVSLFLDSFTYTGPLLLTHWGFSGPGVLKLSAWAARVLAAHNYRMPFSIQWVKGTFEEILGKIREHKERYPLRNVATDPLFNVPRNLWGRLCALSEKLQWGQLSNKALADLAHKLYRDVYAIEGKTTYKQEFVTAGGVDLDEVNFKTMESKIVPHLYFAGEILDIDGITGGFNFQNAWTTGYLAGTSIDILRNSLCLKKSMIFSHTYRTSIHAGSCSRRGGDLDKSLTRRNIGVR